MDKKHQKYPQNGGFPQFVTPQNFFQKLGSVTVMQKNQKKLMDSLLDI